MYDNTMMLRIMYVSVSGEGQDTIYTCMCVASPLILLLEVIQPPNRVVFILVVVVLDREGAVRNEMYREREISMPYHPKLVTCPVAMSMGYG